jgi:hypothetical protein
MRANAMAIDEMRFFGSGSADQHGVALLGGKAGRQIADLCLMNGRAGFPAATGSLDLHSPNPVPRQRPSYPYDRFAGFPPHLGLVRLRIGKESSTSAGAWYI